MSAEAVNFTSESGEKEKLLIVDTDNPNRKIIIPPEGPRVYREQLTANIGNKAIDDIFLYSQDPMEAEFPHDPYVDMKMGGLWTIGHHYTKQAIDMAQHGHDFATFIPNFNYPVWRPLYDAELRKSPYIWHAKNGLQVAQAILHHTGTEQLRVSGHSYAGHTVTTLIAHRPELFKSVVLEDPSGPDTHDVKPRELVDKELRPALQIMGEDLDMLPSNTKERSIRRITDHGIHAAREIIGLRAVRPEFRINLKAAREAGVPVALLLLTKSAIFNAARVRRIAEEEGLFDLIGEVDEYHIAPNIRPAAVNETERELFHRLAA